MIKSKIFVFLFKGLIIQGRDTDETDTTLHKFVKFFKLAWKKDDQTPWADVDFVFTTNLSDGKSVGAWCAAYQDKNQFLQIQIEEGTMVGGE